MAKTERQAINSVLSFAVSLIFSFAWRRLILQGVFQAQTYLGVTN